MQALGVLDSQLVLDKENPLLLNIVNGVSNTKRASESARWRTKAPGPPHSLELRICASSQTDPPEGFLTLEEKLRALEDVAAAASAGNDEDRHRRIEERMLR